MQNVEWECRMEVISSGYLSLCPGESPSRHQYVPTLTHSSNIAGTSQLIHVGSLGLRRGKVNGACHHHLSCPLQDMICPPHHCLFTAISPLPHSCITQHPSVLVGIIHCANTGGKALAFPPVILALTQLQNALWHYCDD